MILFSWFTMIFGESVWKCEGFCRNLNSNQVQTMKKICYLIFLFSFEIFAQNEVFRIDSIPQQGILLDKGWKFHAGDNPDFAKPDFDDSKWENIDPTKDVMDLKQFGKQNVGWFRLTFKVDSSLLGQTFALSVRQVGSSQIFNNGSLITQIGEFSTKTTESKGYDPSGTSYRLTLSNEEIQTISVKFEKPNLFLIKHIGYNNNCLLFQIVKIEHSNALFNIYNRHDLIGFALDYFKSGVFLLIAFLHLWLFGVNKKNIHNLIFGLWAFTITLLFLFGNYSFYPIGIKERNQVSAILTISIPILSLMHCYAVYKTFALKSDIYLKSVIVLCIISITGIFLFYGFGWSFGMVFMALLTSLLIFKISWKVYKKGDLPAKAIALSELIYIICTTFVFFFSERFSNLIHITLIKNAIYNFGFLLPPIAIVYYFAYYFNINSRNLQNKLIEVEALSSEKQETLQKQNAELQAALLKGQTIERQRVAADLHDNLGSTLSALWLNVDMIDKSKMNDEEREIHQNLRENLEKAYNDVRLLSHNLLPEEFEKQGLVPTLQGFVRKISKNSKIHFDLQIAESFGRVDNKIEFELYSICLELVNNIIKHSKATEAKIELSRNEKQILLVVSDNGIGAFKNDSDGKGMKNVKARVESLNGVWKLQSIDSEGVSNKILIPV